MNGHLTIPVHGVLIVAGSWLLLLLPCVAVGYWLGRTTQPRHTPRPRSRRRARTFAAGRVMRHPEPRDTAAYTQILPRTGGHR